MQTDPGDSGGASDAGTATYAVPVRSGEEILVSNGRQFRVLDVVPFEEEAKSRFVGLLQVEAAYGGL